MLILSLACCALNRQGISKRGYQLGCLIEALNSAEHRHWQQGDPISKDLAHRLLEACNKRRDLILGRRIQLLMKDSGIDSSIVLSNYLIRLFSSCGSLAEANHAFNRVSEPDQHTWVAIVDTFSKLGEGEMALQLFNKMHHEGTIPNKFVYPSILKACGCISAIDQGRSIHEQIVQVGFQSDVVIGSALVDMYVKCEELEEACKIFEKLEDRNVITWNVMIAGYGQNGEGVLALECFDRMQHQGENPDKFTFSSILKACASIGAIEHGRHIHKLVIERGLQSDNVIGNTLIDMYAKCKSLEDSLSIFDRLPYRDVMAWGAMIEGYAEHDEGILALQCFECMQHERVKPSKVTFLSVLKGCGSIGAIGHGRYIHEQIIASTQSDIVLGNAMVDMYAKCGGLDEACSIFDSLPQRNVISWGAMIAAYAQFGETATAVQCFHKMQSCGIEANSIIFTGILTAFNRGGMVEEGLCYFKTMINHGIKPSLCHSTCMVDLLGRAGCFKEGRGLLKDILQPDICLWMTLLTACKIHCNVELGRQCFDEIVCLDPLYAVVYVIMSDMYAEAHMKEAANEIEMLKHMHGHNLDEPVYD